MSRTHTSMADGRRKLSQAEITLHRLLETRDRVQSAEREVLCRRIAELQDEIAALRTDLPHRRAAN